MVKQMSFLNTRPTFAESVAQSQHVIRSVGMLWNTGWLYQ